MVRMDPQTYAEYWENESTLLSSQGVYECLDTFTPTGRVLEVGAGIGLATVVLAATRTVLALDSNPHLVTKARTRILSADVQAEIVVTDFLAPSSSAIERIQEFAPEVIVGWFLGSNADDQERHVAAEVSLEERAKKYREHVEDALVTAPLCQPSVKWVHVVSRGGRIEGFSLEEAKRAHEDDYNKYVFHPNGFDVADVQFFDWDRGTSQFNYGDAPNPNLAPGQKVPVIMSLLAKRRA